MMKDMGAPVNLDSRPSQSKYPRAYTRFRAVGCAVIATLRFRYILRRKMHHLRSQINKLQRHTQKALPRYGIEELYLPHLLQSQQVKKIFHLEQVHGKDTTTARQTSPIGLSTGIQTVLSGYPASVSHPLSSSIPSQSGSVPLSSLQSYPSLLSTSPQRVYTKPKTRQWPQGITSSSTR